ncbi:MAG: Trm112 family protein [Phycisphaerales bacterium]|nr:Trm112 family protein [Phycisphaerales bacterium]MCB9862443.1 Trm112 family protein [Phycisphaerales bacterium]
MSEANPSKGPVIDPEFLKILACPKCRAAVAWESPSSDDARDDKLDGWLVCQGADCRLRYPVREGIPEMLIDEAAPPR